jgi:hypothetical protein
VVLHDIPTSERRKINPASCSVWNSPAVPHVLDFSGAYRSARVSTMNNLSSDPLRPLRHEPVRTSIEVSAAKNGAGVDLGLRDEEQAFELPAQLFEQLPFAVYLCESRSSIQPPRCRTMGPVA